MKTQCKKNQIILVRVTSQSKNQLKFRVNWKIGQSTHLKVIMGVLLCIVIKKSKSQCILYLNKASRI